MNLNEGLQDIGSQMIIDALVSLGLLQKISNLIEPPQADAEVLQQSIKLLKFRVNNNYLYTDSTFPPQDKSLYVVFTPLFRDVVWKRLPNFVPKEQQCFLRSSQIAHFTPSSLINDNYLVSAVNILFSKLNLILRIFQITQVNEVGMFAVWVNECGQWKLVIIDDNFPCQKNQYCLASNDRGIWLMILEQALAQIYRPVGNLHEGFCSYLLTDLTGSPCELKDDGESDEWWDKIQNWSERNFLIFAENQPDYSGADGQKQQNSQAPTSKSELKNTLKMGFTFAILDYREVPGVGEKRGFSRIIKLKSPVKAVIWNGEWAYSSSQWTSSIRDYLGIDYFQSSDGTFWMSIQELRDNFQCIGACQTHENYKYKWLPIDHGSQQTQSIFEFQINKATHIYISIHQKDPQLLNRIVPNYDFSPVRMILARVDKKDETSISYQFINGCYDSSRETVIQDFLYEGTYILTLEANWNQKAHRKCTLSFLANNLPEDVVVQKKSDKILEIQQKIFVNMALNHPYPTQKLRDYSQNKEPQIRVYNDMVFGVLYFFYRNKGTQKLQEQVTMTELDNLLICPPQTDSQTFTVELSPGNEILILYKYDPQGETFSFNASIKAALESVPGFSNDIQKESGVSGGSSSNSNGPEITQSSAPIGGIMNKSTNQTQPQNNFGEADGEVNMKGSQIGRLSQVPSQEFPSQLMKNSGVEKKGSSLQYRQEDLVVFMIKNAQSASRIWNDQEINVKFFNYQHPDGVVMLVVNNSESIYLEKMEFSLTNLRIEPTKNATIDGLQVKFTLNPYENIIIYLEVINQKDPFNYTISSQYSYNPLSK